MYCTYGGVCFHITLSIPPTLCLLPALPMSVSLFSLSVFPLLLCKSVHLYYLSGFRIYALVYDISFSLSDLLHSVWQSLGSSGVSFWCLRWIQFKTDSPWLWEMNLGTAVWLPFLSRAPTVPWVVLSYTSFLESFMSSGPHCAHKRWASRAAADIHCGKTVPRQM